MKRIFMNKLVLSIILASLLLSATGCRDSSLEDFDEAEVMSSAASSVTPTPSSEDETAQQLSIADSTAQPTLSEIELSNDLSGSISIDGSALMSAISDKIAEQFRKACPKMTIKTALSGTEEGISKFISGNIDICNTSRQLSVSEVQSAKTKGLDYVELKAAYDGVVIVVNKGNPVDTISLKEILSIWKPDSSLITWNEVNPKWPENDLMVFGPKANTGLIEFFTRHVLKTADNQIGIYTEVSSDNELIKNITGDNTAIGLTSFANYFNARDSIKALRVDFGSGAVLPDVESIKAGKYQQLSSPMYLYVSKVSLQKQEIKAFVQYYLQNASKIVTEAGYVPLSDKDYTEELAKIN